MCTRFQSSFRAHSELSQRGNRDGMEKKISLKSTVYVGEKKIWSEQFFFSSRAWTRSEHDLNVCSWPNAARFFFYKFSFYKQATIART
jgi:hypothetical protein